MHELRSEVRGRQRVVSIAQGRPDPRADVLIHAAAQLPDRLFMEVPADGHQAAALRCLAAAYGIEDRVEVGTENESRGPDATLGAASAGNVEPRLGWRVKDTDGDATTVSTMAELVERLYEADDPPASSRHADDVLHAQRIVVVTNLPTHYRVPLFNGLAERVAQAGGDFNVLFTERPERSSRKWLRHAPIEFEHRFLRSGGTRLGEKAPLDLATALRRLRPSVVVAAGFAPMIAGRAAHYAARRGIPYGIWSGETHRQRTAHGAVRHRERAWIARRASFGIGYGWLSREYLRDLRPELPVVIGRNTAPFLDEPVAHADRSLVQVLALAQAIPRKGLDVAVDAFLQLGDGPWRLTVGGGGSALDALKARAKGAGQIRFLGAIPSDEVLDCYRGADIFLFPSRSDVFGLTLVEAMGAGLATITAASPGAVPDLSVDGLNCVVVDEHKPELWASAIRQVVGDPALRRGLAGGGRSTVMRRWTLEHSVDAWLAGVRLGLLKASR